MSTMYPSSKTISTFLKKYAPYYYFRKNLPAKIKSKTSFSSSSMSILSEAINSANCCRTIHTTQSQSKINTININIAHPKISPDVTGLKLEGYGYGRSRNMQLRKSSSRAQNNVMNVFDRKAKRLQRDRAALSQIDENVAVYDYLKDEVNRFRS